MGNRRFRLTVPLVAGAALLVGLFTVYLHAKELGRSYFDEYQAPRHLALLTGTAGNPWQYRILSAWVVEAAHQVLRAFGLPSPLLASFLGVRVLQEALLFLIGWRYWRTLGLTTPQAWMGLVLMGWSISYSNFHSDLQFNTYFDVVFYLMAGLATVSGRWGWILPLTLVSALNRETSGFIPLLPLAAAWTSRPEARPRAIRIAIAGLAIYFGVFFGLRYLYGPQTLILPFGHRMGLDLLHFNLTEVRTWVQLFGTFSILPALALFGYRQWPPALRGFFWMVVPVWFLVHWVSAVMAETRLMLVPQALVFVPGAMMFVRSANGPSRPPEPA